MDAKMHTIRQRQKQDAKSEVVGNAAHTEVFKED
jgi:hypothetical protein